MALKDSLEALWGFLASRRTAYVRTFEGPEAEKVLADLARFCRAGETTFHSDPRIHAVAEGRREVWLRIAKHLHLSDEQLFELYAAKTAKE